MMTSDLSIICVNWNSVVYLEKCLTSIYSQSQSIAFEVIVVDNASFDGAAKLIQEKFPQVTFVQSIKNIGFARANNLGFAHSTGRNILLLNPDTEVVGAAIPTMLSALESLPGAGVAGCKLLNSDLSIQTSCIQRFPTISNQALDMKWLMRHWPKSRLWGKGPLFSNSAEPAKVDIVSGACLMIKREVLERVGLLSPEYFMYAEDVDLCYRVHKLGLRVYYVSKASVIHHGGRSSEQTGSSQWVSVMQARAMLKFFENAYGKRHAFTYKVMIGAMAAIRLTIVALASPFVYLAFGVRPLSRVFGKWIGALKWALSLDKAAGDSTAAFN
jgi:N-acetylglucosaminyl-diphospho-decaprenol L-rhamnosyltransferase